jgi:protein-tyrosine kinase
LRSPQTWPRQARRLRPATPAAADNPVHDRSIGDIIAELRNLGAEQVEQVLQHQRRTGVRFGEAAVALGFASKDDVLVALSRQFHYPYAPEEERAVSPELVALNEPFGTRPNTSARCAAS